MGSRRPSSASRGEPGFWTSSGSGKAKRLRHTARVTVQPCDARGAPTPGAAVTEGTARLVAEGPQLEEVRRGIRAKYGLQARFVPYLVRLATLVRGRRSPYGDVAVVIRPA